MQLKPVSTLDILVFLLFLTVHLLTSPHLLLPALTTFLRALPFLLLQLPRQLLLAARWERYSLFQNVVLRCTKWAFCEMPSEVGRAFFAKEVVMPYLRFRMWRCSYTGPSWHEVSGKVRGLWISHATTALPPDVVIYYLHGGGFVWGSPHFYLEYLLLFCALLRDEAGFASPAVFALEYSLVPENVWPAQLAETVDGYRYVRARAARGNVVLAGDSAGAALALGLLLFLRGRETPAFAALVSPWARLHGGYGDSCGDYLEESRLREVAGLYAAGEDLHAPLLAPAECVDDSWWRESLPAAGMAVYWGSREVLRPGIVELVARLGRVAKVVARENYQVHCWPVAAVFLAKEPEERESALNVMCRDIAQALQGCA